MQHREPGVAHSHVLFGQGDVFTSPGTGVSSTNHHGMNEGVARGRLDDCQDVIHVGQCKEQAVPQLRFHRRSQASTRDLAVDLRPSLECRLFAGFGIADALQRERSLKVAGVARRIPHHDQRR